MLQSPDEIQLAKTVAALVHKQSMRDAAQHVADFLKLDVPKIEDAPQKYLPILQNYLHFLMNSGGMEEAAQLLWTPTQFTPEPQSVRDIWQHFDEATTGLIMGAASMGKSFSVGVRMFLEWIRDPQWTTVKVVGPSEDHLESNLFSHLVGLHQKSSLPMPGEVGELFIGIDRRNQYSSIKGIIIPVGNTKKAGRLQGTKRINRDKPHPEFGPLSRLFIFVDEVENVPGGIWPDIDNVLATVDEEKNSGTKIFCAYNPRDQAGEVGKRAEPVFGWQHFDVDTHFKWKSVRGWDVLRLDGEKSENVVQGKKIYPGLQTRAGLEKIAKNSGGRESAGYYTMGRGAYPPMGLELSVIPEGMFMKWFGEFIWYDAPDPCAGCDLALDGGANAVYTLGKVGYATGIKFPPSMEFPQGTKVMFKDKAGRVVPRFACQADQQFILPKGETVAMARKIVEINKKAGVRPEHYCNDSTGHGRGVSDMIKYEWSSAIWAVNYSDGASETKIMLEDTKTCAQVCERMCSELWFALRAFGEHQYFLMAPTMDREKLTPQVTKRKFRGGAKSRVESKKDYMSRGNNESPDEADSLTLFLHAARKATGIIPSMRGDPGESPMSDDSDWYEQQYPGGVRIDPSNQTDFLDLTGA